MNIEQIETVACTEMAHRRDIESREPGWSYYHGMRTGKIAQHLARTLGSDADPDTLYVAGLFHDVGKGGKRHNEVGAEMTRELLAGLVPSERLGTICETVRCHCLRKESGDPTNGFTDISKLVQDADLIDHVGHIDIWLGNYWAGHHGQTIDERLAWFNGDQITRHYDYMRTHLNFALSLEILNQRIEMCERFTKEFHRIYADGI